MLCCVSDMHKLGTLSDYSVDEKNARGLTSPKTRTERVHVHDCTVLLNEIQSASFSSTRWALHSPVDLRMRTLGCEMMQGTNLSDATGFH